MSGADPLAEGTPAPPFELTADDGRTVRLEDLRGRWVILYFYPRAMTPGCTTEACGFRDTGAELRDLGAEVVGVSPDPPERLARFRERHGLDFVLLADPEHRVAEAYGVWGPKKFMGREREGVHRTTFLIDPEGRVARVWRRVRVQDHAAEVAAALRQLAGR